MSNQQKADLIKGFPMFIPIPPNPPPLPLLLLKYLVNVVLVLRCFLCVSVACYSRGHASTSSDSRKVVFSRISTRLDFRVVQNSLDRGCSASKPWFGIQSSGLLLLVAGDPPLGSFRSFFLRLTMWCLPPNSSAHALAHVVSNERSLFISFIQGILSGLVVFFGICLDFQDSISEPNERSQSAPSGTHRRGFTSAINQAHFRLPTTLEWSRSWR